MVEEKSGPGATDAPVLVQRQDYWARLTINRRRAEPANNGPTLRRSTRSGTGPIDDRDPPPDKDERPTLKRRQP